MRLAQLLLPLIPSPTPQGNFGKRILVHSKSFTRDYILPFSPHTQCFKSTHSGTSEQQTNWGEESCPWLFCLTGWLTNHTPPIPWLDLLTGVGCRSHVLNQLKAEQNQLNERVMDIPDKKKLLKFDNFLTCSIDLCPENILYSLWSFGGTLLSIVWSLEVVCILEYWKGTCICSMVKSIGGMWFVCCTEIVHTLKSPLLHCSYYNTSKY